MSAQKIPGNRPSSTAFSAELETDPASRLAIVVAAMLLYAAGSGLLVLIELGLGPRLCLAAGCLAFGILDCRRFLLRQSGVTTLRVFPGGQVRVRGERAWSDAEFVPGCVVLRRWAWLRLRRADGELFRCFLLASRQHADDWRRFLVISRHIGADS